MTHRGKQKPPRRRSVKEIYPPKPRCARCGREIEASGRKGSGSGRGGPYCYYCGHYKGLW